MDSLFSFFRDYWWIVLPLLIVIGLILAILVKKGILRRVNVAGVELEFERSTEKKGSHELFARSDSAEFAQLFESLAHKADRIVLIGTGINILHRDPILLDLLERVSKGKCVLEIYLANPFSRHIETRLIEEEIGNMKPPVGKQGLIQRLETMIEKQKELGYPSNFVLTLFSNYPTVAMFIIDTEYFLYPYGYALLGNQSPIMQFSRTRPGDRPMIDFMETQYQKIKSSSVDARLVMDIYHKRKPKIENLTPFAVYLIPRPDSSLYRFGSQMIGYDIYENRPCLSPWAAYVGTAGDFGFHLTVADALYLYNPRDMDLLQKELEFVVQGISRLKLKLRLKPEFPNRSSVSLVCEDSSGVLEYLHHEMVARCYRSAAGSNYDFGIASLDRDDNTARAKLMIQQYHAPYILNAYIPHFTLLTNLPAARTERQPILDEVEKAFREQGVEDTLEFENLFVMQRTNPLRPWQIAKELQFR